MPPDLKQLPKRFGKAVREARTEAKLTQMVLAEKADLTLNYVGEVERGEKLASIETAARLASALGMTAAELMERAGL
jgi:transcriptional regulator with XRE-family HTH domain